MTDDNIRDFIDERLKRIESKLDRALEDVGNLKQRTGHTETMMAGLKTDIAHLHTIAAEHSNRFDSLDDHLDRIERRLALKDDDDDRPSPFPSLPAE